MICIKNVLLGKTTNLEYSQEVINLFDKIS